MLAVISPAKTLDFESPPLTQACSEPDFLEHSQLLVNKLKRMSGKKLGSLMSISRELALLNSQRFQDWEAPFTAANAKQALLAFRGDVYTGFDLESFKENDFDYAQDHLRILSGLYGLLRPLDLIQPYRLEMGTKLATRRGKDLYKFWDQIPTLALNRALESSGSEVLVNLASQEYFSAVKPKQIKGRIVTPVFKDFQKGEFKVISFFAKKARGAMTDYMIRNRTKDPDGLKEFRSLGYGFDSQASDNAQWVFTRREAA